MQPFCRGRFIARLSRTDDDLRRAQGLRALAFLRRDGAEDSDTFDAICHHVLVEHAGTGTLVCCFRLLPLRSGAEIGRSYAAQHYDLTGLEGFRDPMVEVGRFCIHPDWHDADILRIAWGMMACVVQQTGAGMLFGCSSFMGTDPAPYHAAFALLKARHLAPAQWLPGRQAPDVYPFAQIELRPDARRAMRAMPPLLKSYLALGAWVSDHAVVDRQMNTLHVFTGLQIRSIPPARARLLRALAG
jgi:putative hemolysin